MSAEIYLERYGEIVAAATRVFNKKGYQGTTIAAIADELNIDRASIYYYISSKEELYDQLVRDAALDNVTKAREILKSDLSPPEKLKAFMIETMATYERHYPLLYILVRENLNNVADARAKWAREMKKHNRDYFNVLVSILESGVEDGSFVDIGPIEIVANGVMGMVGWTNRWFKPDRAEMSASAIGEIYADIVLSGLSGGKPTASKRK